MTPRFTRADLETINSALAYYEAEDSEAFGVETEEQERRHFHRIEQARAKVHARLAALGWSGEED